MNRNELLQQQEEFRKFEQNKNANLNQKIETESLCGLKVQYRPKGMENNNSDDDADVVIEEESTDYRIETPETEKINVCQFLSPPTESAPKNTFPKVQFINTPSPPRTPVKVPSSHHKSPSVLSRIESDIKKGYKVLILMRGLPGSGKSYLSKLIVMRSMHGSDLKNHIFSTDDYFKIKNKGVFVYNPDQIADAHAWNQNRVLNAMKSGWSPVIVDNTNTQAWEMQNYAAFAIQHGYILETLEPDTPWSRDIRELDRRNIHHVPKARIRSMLERYEPNITGDRLLNQFKLRYMPHNQPPQMRLLPPLIMTDDELDRKFKKVTIKERSVRRKQKNTNELKKAQNTESKCQVDNNALSTIAIEYANLDKVDNVSSNIDIKRTNECWTAGSSYKEENLLDLSKLGAIGCERKVSNIFNKNEEDINSPTVNSNFDEVEKDDNDSSNISQCWDFTLLKDGMQIHSKIIEDKNVSFDDSKLKVFVNNGEITFIENCKIVKTEVSDKIYSNSSEKTINISGDNSLDLQAIDLEENCKMEITIATPPTPASENTTNSECSSLERVSDVDMSQFDLCNVDNMQTPKQDETNTGLSSIFSFIKNSLLGNEKEKVLISDENSLGINMNPTCVSADGLTDKMRSNKKFVDNSSPSSQMSVSRSVSADTLSKHLNSSNPINSDNNLNLEIQENFEFPSELMADNEQKKDLLKVKENVEVEYTTNENIVRELLEASSDFQLVEDYYFTENIIKNKEKKKCNVDYEKILSEDTKNFQIVANNEEDENKVSKKPIDKFFGSKNTFPEKIQNAISDLDNINLINWRESPFPQLKTVTVELNSQTTNSIETKESGTNTDPYDFNVAFIGGTDEFVTLNTNSRNINESNHQLPSQEAQCSGKLKLHKGTMTNASTIIFKSDNLDSEDRSEELIKRFSHLPEACVLDVYKNLCKHDFDWTLDYLNNFQNDDATILAAIDAIDQLEEGSQLLSVDYKTSSRIESPNGSCRQTPFTRNKKDKFKTTSDHIALKQELESKIEINKESYKPHTLRVKRWKNREFGEIKNEDLINFDEIAETNSTVLQNETITNEQSKKILTMNYDDAKQTPSTSTDDSESNGDEEDEIMELNLGDDFIRVLENEFGNPYFETPQNLFPVIQIKKSMAQELYALWIESIQRQVWATQEKFDEMISKDAEFARLLEKREEETINFKGPEEEVPNLKEIMDMEMALAIYRNDFKGKMKKESSKDLSFRVTQQILHELFPNYDRQMMYEIYEAHDRNFDETLKVIKENCERDSRITMADVLKKRTNLIKELEKERSYQTSRHDQLEIREGYDEACGIDCDDEYYEEQIATQDEALELAQDYRLEARRQLSLRDENNKKAADAYRKKQPEVATYFSDVAKLHIKKMEKANSRAAAAILAAQAHVIDSEDKIDLHHLKVAEALQALDIFLDSQLADLPMSSRKSIYIITGRGLRSVNGRSKIKPAVAKKLNSRNIGFSEANPGMLRAVLQKRK